MSNEDDKFVFCTRCNEKYPALMSSCLGCNHLSLSRVEIRWIDIYNTLLQAYFMHKFSWEIELLENVRNTKGIKQNSPVFFVQAYHPQEIWTAQKVVLGATVLYFYEDNWTLNWIHRISIQKEHAAFSGVLLKIKKTTKVEEHQETANFGIPFYLKRKNRLFESAQKHRQKRASQVKTER